MSRVMDVLPCRGVVELAGDVMLDPSGREWRMRNPGKSSPWFLDVKRDGGWHEVSKHAGEQAALWDLLVVAGEGNLDWHELHRQLFGGE